MSITLKLIHETFEFLFFELPPVISYYSSIKNKIIDYNMNSPSNLIKSLKLNNQNLSCLFENKNDFDCIWDTTKICRKKIIVRKFSCDSERVLFKDKVKKEKQIEKLKSICKVCKTHYTKTKRVAEWCSENCKIIAISNRGKSISKTHWCKSSSNIAVREKINKTRKANDVLLSRKYIPWNKGKTGVYSPETIEKIRNATIKQFHECKVKMTGIEKKMKAFLDCENINSKFSFILKRRQYDFILYDKKILLELHGDFWHGNPKFYGENLKQLRDHQIMKRKDDFVKKRIAEENGFIYIEFWENDINLMWDNVKQTIIEALK